MANYDSKRSPYFLPIKTIVADLQDLSNKTNHFDELRAMLPLLADLKKTESHNKDMNNILEVINKALAQVESSRGTNSKTVGTYSATLSKMLGQTTGEVSKVQTQIQSLRRKEEDFQENVVSVVKKEIRQAKKEIENVVDVALKQVKEYMERQEANQRSMTEWREKTMKDRVNQNSSINLKLEHCQNIMAELICQTTYLKESHNQKHGQKQFPDQVETFISKCDARFRKEGNFVLQKLSQLQEIKEVNEYQGKVFRQYYRWGHRLQVGLESAIIKLSIDFRKNQERHSWGAKVAEWEDMHAQLKQLLK